MNIRRQALLGWALLGGAWALPGLAAEELPASDVVLRALSHELGRAMTLQLEDLQRPYFAQLNVLDSLAYTLTAEYGAATSSERKRARDFFCQLRVGSQELDNTNFSSGDSDEAEGMPLPLDDDYLSLCQEIWRTADAEYKQAIETLTNKRAYLNDTIVEDRPNDFSPAAVAEYCGGAATLDFDRAQWEEKLRVLSAEVGKSERVQDSRVHLTVSAVNKYVVNSEGTRVRYPRCRALLVIAANAQDESGNRFSSSRSYVGASAADFPALEQMLKDITDLERDLAVGITAPVLEQYNGPVLFDAGAAAQVFESLLARGLAGRPDPIGAPSQDSLQRRLGTAILPSSFAVWDDPTIERCDGQVLLGSYPYDDEGVAAQRVELVTGGKLKNFCLSRVPIRKLCGTNGHCRRSDSGALQAATACLYIKDNQAISEDQMKARLIDAARAAGLEYGVRVRSLRTFDSAFDVRDIMPMMTRMIMTRTRVADPGVAYKVYVSDGREEPVRGCHFGRFAVEDLKHIVAAGEKACVRNSVVGVGGPSVSVISPAVLFEELELSKNEQELDNPPLLKAPAFR